MLFQNSLLKVGFLQSVSVLQTTARPRARVQSPVVRPCFCVDKDFFPCNQQVQRERGIISTLESFPSSLLASPEVP